MGSGVPQSGSLRSDSHFQGPFLSLPKPPTSTQSEAPPDWYPIRGTPGLEPDRDNPDWNSVRDTPGLDSRQTCNLTCSLEIMPLVCTSLLPFPASAADSGTLSAVVITASTASGYRLVVGAAPLPWLKARHVGLAPGCLPGLLLDQRASCKALLH